MRETKQYYNNDELELEVDGIYYTADVHATGTYCYCPATRVDPDGSSFDLDSVEVTWYDENGKEVEETKEMRDVLEKYLYEDAEWNDEEYDPPDDYYEEREMARWEAELDRCGL